MLTAAGCGGSSSPKQDGAAPDGSAAGDTAPALAAQLIVNPPSVNFETIEVGKKSSPMLVTVTNVGTAASGPLTVTVSGVGISATGCSGVSLAKGGNCQISVTVLAAVAGQISGTIEVGDTAANTKKIAVSGIAIPPGMFSLAPSPLLDFGPVLAGKTVNGIVVMTNTAPTGLEGIVINVSGAGFVAGTGTCTTALGINQNCNIGVTFTAGAISGEAKGTLSVSQGGVTQNVGLKATVQTPAKLVMTPPSATLSTVVGTPSSPVTFIVTNTGDVTSGIPTVAITGTNKADFSFVSNCGTALVGGATAGCEVKVTYNPKAAPATNSTATLTVAEPGTGGSSVSAVLTGIAYPPSDLAITGTATNFGSVVVGGTSPALTFTLTNKGGVDSGLVKVTGAGQFIVVTDSCSDKSLAAAGFCTFTAAFKPAVGDAGVIQGQFKAVGASVATPAFIGVTGTAVAAAKLAIDKKSLEFGALPTHQESEPQTLVISNVGGAPTGTLKVENTGAQFQIKGDTCTGAILTATGATSSCSITVTFTSTGTDVEATGKIIVTDTTGAGGSVESTLHGTGTAHAGLSMSPSVVCPQYTADDPLCRQSAVVTSLGIFKNKVLGQKTEELAIRVTNATPPTQAPDSGEISFAITGDAAGDFAIVQNNCTVLLSTFDGNPGTGTSCLVTLTFTPSAVGLRKATLVLSTTRGGASQTTLEGKGLAAFEIQPLQVQTDKDGLTFGQVSLGHNDPNSVLPYRVWLRSTTATDKTSTVTLTLPAATPADFVWVAGSTTMAIGGPGNLLTPPVPNGSDLCSVSPPINCSATLPFADTTTVDGGTTRVNPCNAKTVSFAIPAGATTPGDNAGFTYDASSGYFYCDFGVQFYPNSERGPLTAALNGNGTNSGSATLTLTGQAVGPLTINPSPLLVTETVAIGETLTTGLTLTVTNNGGATQTGLSFELGGTGAGDFQIEGTTCWTKVLAKHSLPSPFIDNDLYPVVKIDELAQDESCLVWLGFRPTSELEYAVNVTVKAAGGESATAVVRTTGLKSFAPLTVTPSPVEFDDTPYKKTDATPVVLTIKNSGSLDSGLVTLTITNDNFEIVKETPLPAGACNVSGQWRVPGSGECTIKVRAKPTTAQPAGIGKLQVNGDLIVQATEPNTAGEATTVVVPLTYFVTSNLVVGEVGKDLSSSVTYAFPAKGLQKIDSKRFTVKNISSEDVTLSLQNVGQFSVHNEAITGLTLCIDGFTLNKDETCTLVIDDSHPTVGVVGILTPIKIDVTDSTLPTNYASIYLSSITLSAPMVRAYGLTTSNGGYGTNGTGARISLGTVPFGETTEGVPHQGAPVTLLFRNLGDTPTGLLSTTVVESMTEKGEFTVLTPTAENSGDCLSGDKILQPQEFCTIQVRFTPVSPNPVGNRTASVTLNDASTAVANAGQTVHLAARALDPAVGAWVSLGSTRGFHQFSAVAETDADETTGPTQQFVLHRPTTAFTVTMEFPDDGAFRRVATDDVNECPDDGEDLSDAASTCVFTMAFAPNYLSTPKTVFNWISNPQGGLVVARIYGAGGATDDATIALMGRIQQPANLQIVPPVGMPQLEDGGLDMLKIAVGGSTPEYTLTVINTGDVASTPLSRGVFGTGTAGDPTFAVSEGCFTKDLQPYGTKNTAGVLTDRCTVTVKATAGTTTDDDPITNTLTFDYEADGSSTYTSYDLGVRVVTAAKLEFDDADTGTFATTAVTGYQEKTLTVTNTGAQATGTISVPQPTGTGAAHFQVVGTTCPPNKGLEMGEDCKVFVRFAPTALSASTDAFGATLNVNATPGSAAPFSLIGMPKSALSVDDVTGTPAKVTITSTEDAAINLRVWNDKGVGHAAQTKPLQTSLSDAANFTLIDDQCYGKMLIGNTSCYIQVKYIGAATNTEKTTTLTVNGGSAGQTVTVVVGYTGAAAVRH